MKLTFIIGTLSILFIGHSKTNLKAQCTTTGFANPQMISEGTTVGTISWNNPDGGLASDNNRASAGALLLGDVSHYMIGSDYNFSLTTTSVICGITVEIEKSATGLFQNIGDFSVRLVKNGAIVGNNYAQGGAWPTSDAYYTYGGANDLWGTTWTYSDINNSNFGIAIAANLDGSIVLPSARVDHLRINVHYQDVLPVSFLSCTLEETTTGAIVVSWKTLSERDNDYFILERSQDALDWTAIDTMKGAGNSTEIQEYSMIDYPILSGLYYYRISQVDYDGSTSNLGIYSYELSESQYNINVYPNPNTGNFTINCPNGIQKIELFDFKQALVLEWDVACEQKVDNYQLQQVPAAYYNLVLTDCTGNIHHSKLFVFD